MSTHQQLLYHIVFSTKNRKPYLKSDSFRDSVFAYMAGTCKNLEGFALIIGGYYEHAHLLVSIPPKLAVAKFVGELKACTSKHVNDTSDKIAKFGWQDGYGVFSVSMSQKNRVVSYIENQVEHHSIEGFEQEYRRLLERHGVQFDEQRVFD